MAEEVESGDDDDDGGGSGAPDKKDAKRQVKNEHVLIGIGIVTLILTYVFLKRSSASSAANTANANQSAATPYGTSDGGYDSEASGVGDDSSYDDSILASDIQQLQSEISGLTPPAATTTPTPTTGAGGKWQRQPTSSTSTTPNPTTGYGAIISSPTTVEQDLTSGDTGLMYVGPGVTPSASTPGVPLSLTPGGGWEAGSTPLQSGAGGVVYQK